MLYRSTKKKNDNNESILEIGINHIDGTPICYEVTDINHPPNNVPDFNINEVVEYLQDQFQNEGFGFNDTARLSYITDVRNKHGRIRINAKLYNPDEALYKEILKRTLDKFPRSAPYLDGTYADTVFFFTGTLDQCMRWAKEHKNNSLELLIKNKLEKPSTK